MLKCPRTGQPMVQVTVDGIVVDVSPGCGGVWFDNFELRKFDEHHEDAAHELLKLVEKHHKPVQEITRRLKCPKDTDVTMMRQFFDTKRSVTVDECPACGGVWLDPGELAEIHKAFKTDAERDTAAHQFADELAHSSGLTKMAEESKARAAQAQRFARAFRFICPSAYLPGKQSWGSF